MPSGRYTLWKFSSPFPPVRFLWAWAGSHRLSGPPPYGRNVENPSNRTQTAAPAAQTTQCILFGGLVVVLVLKFAQTTTGAAQWFANYLAAVGVFITFYVSISSPSPSVAPERAASCCSVSAVSHGWCVGQGVWMVFRCDAATYPRQSNSSDSAWCMVAAYRICIRKCNPFHWSFLHEGCRKRCTKGSAKRVQKWLCIPVHQSTPTGVRHSHCYLLGHFKCHFTETQPCTGSPHIQPVPVSPRSSWYILRWLIFPLHRQHPQRRVRCFGSVEICSNKHKPVQTGHHPCIVCFEITVKRQF